MDKDPKETIEGHEEESFAELFEKSYARTGRLEPGEKSGGADTEGQRRLDFP